MRMAWVHDEEDHPLSERGIEQRNHALLRRYREFRRGADAVAAAWRAHPEVIAVSLIGSVARAPWKEVPRFGPYRRARVALWHECKDVDLALWLEHLDSLDGLRRAKARAMDRASETVFCALCMSPAMACALALAASPQARCNLLSLVRALA